MQKVPASASYDCSTRLSFLLSSSIYMSFRLNNVRKYITVNQPVHGEWRERVRRLAKTAVFTLSASHNFHHIVDSMPCYFPLSNNIDDVEPDTCHQHSGITFYLFLFLFGLSHSSHIVCTIDPI